MPDTLHMAVVTLALDRIGHGPITGLDEDTDAARLCARRIDHALRATLRHHPWAFATKYADPMTLVAGAEGAPVNRDWTYAYAYPTDCLFVRRLLTDTKRAFADPPRPFRVGREGDALVVYTDEPDAGIEYTAIFDCPVEIADELFIAAAAWRLAHDLAPALSRNKVTATEAWSYYAVLVNSAAAVASREAQTEPGGAAEWDRAR